MQLTRRRPRFATKAKARAEPHAGSVMRQIDRLYDWLSQGPTPDCDRILAAALTHTEPIWGERIVRVLLGRGHDASFAALIGHYGSLNPDIREQLHKNTELTHTAIAMAFKSPDADRRANALLALHDTPSARLAYLLSDALRDPAPRVRELAARILRRIAELLCDRAEEVKVDATRQAEYETDRRQFILTLAEALRSFTLHNRVDVLETCLWFSRDLGDALWDELEARRSRVGRVTHGQLLDWSHPRLAHFIVTALGRTAWRGIAAEVLQRWHGIPCLTALMRQSELLDNDDIRRGLAAVHNPRWFAEIDFGLIELPVGLRPMAPRWVCNAGYNVSQKEALLTRWLRAPDPRIHSATVHACAETMDGVAHTLLAEVTRSSSPLAAFAHSCLIRSSDNPGETPGENAPPEAAPGQTRAPTPVDAEIRFDALWQAGRHTPPNERGDLLESLREHAPRCRAKLKSYLDSPDPLDRVLALQVASTEELARAFHAELEPLTVDPVNGIRELTITLLRTIPEPNVDPTEQTTDMEPTPPGRQELLTLLEQISHGDVHAEDADLVDRVRDLLRDVYDEHREAVTADNTTEEQA